MTKQGTRLLIMLIAVVAIGAAGYMTAQAQSGRSKPAPSAVAVVDVKEAFDALKEKVQIEADLQAEADRIRQEQEKRANEIKQLQSDIEILPADSPTAREKRNELERKSVDIQAWLAYHTRKVQRERIMQTEALYNKMMAQIEQLAQDQGYDIVLFKEPPLRLNPNLKPEQIAPLIQVRKLLYHRPGVDITQDLIQRMNLRFDAGS